MNDFETMFNSAVDADTGDSGEGQNGGFEISRNADVHTGEDGVGQDSFDETSSDDVSASTTDVQEASDGGQSEPVSFDWTANKDHLVTVKVNGEDVVMPLGEAMNGVMRQADYTKKTQSIAEAAKAAQWARELVSALNSDPNGTLQFLSEQFGVEVERGPGSNVDVFDGVDPEFQPFVETIKSQQAQIEQFNAWKSQVENERVMSEVRAEVDSVQTEFKDFDPATVLPLAARTGLTVRDAYLLSKSQELIANQSNATLAAAQASAQAAILAEKRSASKLVAGGAQPRAEVKDQIPKFDSFAEMFEWNQNNLTSP